MSQICAACTPKQIGFLHVLTAIGSEGSKEEEIHMHERDCMAGPTSKHVMTVLYVAKFVFPVL